MNEHQTVLSGGGTPQMRLDTLDKDIEFLKSVLKLKKQARRKLAAAIAAIEASNAPAPSSTR